MAVTKRKKAGAQALPRDISKFTNRDPSASLFDGRTVLGFLFDHDDGRCSAASADHKMIGDYADRTAARAAITLHHESNSVP
jgi:hypothetical protein